MLTIDLRFREILEELAKRDADQIASDAMGSHTADIFQYGQACGRHYVLTQMLPLLCEEAQRLLFKGN